MISRTISLLGTTSADTAFAAVGLCRQLIEMSVRTYKMEHKRYLHQTKNSLCKCCIEKFSTTAALDHMSECNGKLEAWQVFKNNHALYNALSGRTVFGTLSHAIHSVTYPKQNMVYVPEWLPPKEKRFMLLLLLDSNYEVQIIDHTGKTRLPVPAEVASSPESSIASTSPNNSKTNKKMRLSKVEVPSMQHIGIKRGRGIDKDQASVGVNTKKNKKDIKEKS